MAFINFFFSFINSINFLLTWINFIFKIDFLFQQRRFCECNREKNLHSISQSHFITFRYGIEKKCFPFLAAALTYINFFFYHHHHHPPSISQTRYFTYITILGIDSLASFFLSYMCKMSSNNNRTTKMVVCA